MKGINKRNIVYFLTIGHLKSMVDLTTLFKKMSRSSVLANELKNS